MMGAIVVDPVLVLLTLDYSDACPKFALLFLFR